MTDHPDIVGLMVMGYIAGAVVTGLTYMSQAKRIPLSECLAAGVFWWLVLPFVICIGIGRLAMRAIRLGFIIKRDSQRAVQPPGSSVVVRNQYGQQVEEVNELWR